VKFWLKYVAVAVLISLHGHLYGSWWSVIPGVVALVMYFDAAYAPKGSARWTVSGYTDEEVADLKKAIEETKEAK